MRAVFYKALPWRKEEVTLALESGVDGLIVPDAQVDATRALARCTVIPESGAIFIRLDKKADEERAADLARARAVNPEAPLVTLCRGWEIIPLENLLASSTAAPAIAVEVADREEALLAAGVLERGVDTVVVPPEGVHALKGIVAALKYNPPGQPLVPAVITRISPAGMGHRVCVDTTSLFASGQGMLVGNSAAFTFLVNAETERNEYVAARPFRINAGGVHAYARMPEDRTAYLEELRAGSEVLIVDHKGACSIATVGRVKVERRPMLLVEAEIQSVPPAAKDRGSAPNPAGQENTPPAAGGHDAPRTPSIPAAIAKQCPPDTGSDATAAVPPQSRKHSAKQCASGNGGSRGIMPLAGEPDGVADPGGWAAPPQKKTISGAVFLQNAETIRLVRPDGAPVSVVDLKVGDTVLCRSDVAGRHFGMRISEDIREL